MKNILIIRLSAIGDVVHVLPCLHALRIAFPLAHIGWVVEELSAALLKGHPEIDELFVIPKKHWRAHPVRTLLNGEKSAFYSHLRETHWDVAIDFQGLTKSGWPAWRSGAPLRIGFGGVDCREINRCFTNRRVIPPTSARHVIERNLSLLAPLGITAPEVAWRFPDFESEHCELAPFLNSLGGAGFIALYPGAGWETKRWPPHHFASLAKLLQKNSPTGKPIPQVLMWGPGEESLCRQIQTEAALPSDALIIAPRTNLRQLTALLSQASLVIGGDTGPIHLAAALGKPVIGIYGGSDPLRNGPWGQRNIIIQADPAQCRTCWRTKCNNANALQCLISITPPQVAEAACDFLKKI